MDQEIQDYLFDLQGYLVLENAISKDDLKEMNGWIDAHWDYVEEPWEENTEDKRIPRWTGNIETHTYNVENGVNFQNIIEGGDVFQKLIDHPRGSVSSGNTSMKSMGSLSTRISSTSAVLAVSFISTVVDTSP